MAMSDEIYEMIIDYVENHPGPSSLQLNIKDYEHEFTLELVSKSHNITVEYEFIEYLKSLPNIDYKLN